MQSAYVAADWNLTNNRDHNFSPVYHLQQNGRFNKPTEVQS